MYKRKKEPRQGRHVYDRLLSLYKGTPEIRVFGMAVLRERGSHFWRKCSFYHTPRRAPRNGLYPLEGRKHAQNVYFEPPAAPGPHKTRIPATTCVQGAELGASCVRRGGGIGAPRRWITFSVETIPQAEPNGIERHPKTF